MWGRGDDFLREGFRYGIFLESVVLRIAFFQFGIGKMENLIFIASKSVTYEETDIVVPPFLHYEQRFLSNIYRRQSCPTR